MADGRVALRADCNCGFGGYTLDGNRLNFGPLATTLIACPPGSLDGVFLRQLDQVTSYLFADGDLILDLASDSGGMRFAPSAQYALRVRITTPDGRVWFINDSAYFVITRDRPTSGIEVVLVRAG